MTPNLRQIRIILFYKNDGACKCSQDTSERLRGDYWCKQTTSDVEQWWCFKPFFFLSCVVRSLTLLSLRAFVIQKVALKHPYCVGIVPVSCCCCLTAFTRWRTMSLTGHFTFPLWSFALEFNLWHFINIAPGLIDPLLFLGHYFEDLHTCTWSTHQGPMMTAMSGGHY